VLGFTLTPLAISQDDQLTVTVPLVDESAVAGPISTTGKAVFSEKMENGKAVCSYRCEIESRNVSQQPIVLLVVAEEFCCSNGPGAKHKSEYDYFFNRALLGSGKTITYPSHQCMSERMVGPVPSIARVPTAEATTVYVQFQNGTSFGDDKYAMHILQVRQGALTALRRLQEIYQTRGAKKFREALRRGSDLWEIGEAASVEDLVIQPLRRIQREFGTLEVVRRIQEKLSNAEVKMAKLDAKTRQR
jgi:hypothetical protein